MVSWAELEPTHSPRRPDNIFFWQELCESTQRSRRLQEKMRHALPDARINLYHAPAYFIDVKQILITLAARRTTDNWDPETAKSVVLVQIRMCIYQYVCLGVYRSLRLFDSHVSWSDWPSHLHKKQCKRPSIHTYSHISHKRHPEISWVLHSLWQNLHFSLSASQHTDIIGMPTPHTVVTQSRYHLLYKYMTSSNHMFKCSARNAYIHCVV